LAGELAAAGLAARDFVLVAIGIPARAMKSDFVRLRNAN
jgi:hypothetical protein